MIELTADNQIGKPSYEGYLNGRADGGGDDPDATAPRNLSPR